MTGLSFRKKKAGIKTYHQSIFLYLITIKDYEGGRWQDELGMLMLLEWQCGNRQHCKKGNTFGFLNRPKLMSF